MSKETSELVASEAARLLADPNTPADIKSVAGSALAQHEKEEKAEKEEK